MSENIGFGNKQDKWTKRVTQLINWLNENKSPVLVEGSGIALTPNEDGTITISLTEYSLEEKVVGSWIDGSTLYEKVYRINDRGSNIPANLLSDLNIAMIIDCSIMLFENNNCTRQDLTYNVQTKLLSGIPSNQWIDHIIVRYIKST